MTATWDPLKAAANYRKHGVRFSDALDRIVVVVLMAGRGHAVDLRAPRQRTGKEDL